MIACTESYQRREGLELWYGGLAPDQAKYGEVDK
jgi:hypothetical protein